MASNWWLDKMAQRLPGLDLLAEFDLEFLNLVGERLLVRGVDVEASDVATRCLSRTLAAAQRA